MKTMFAYRRFTALLRQKLARALPFVKGRVRAGAGADCGGKTTALVLCALISALAHSSASLRAQDDGDGTRALWDKSFLIAKNRPSGRRKTKTSAPSQYAKVSRQKPVAPRVKSPSAAHAFPPPPKDLQPVEIGLTLWRLRPAKPNDPPSVRVAAHEADGDLELIPERITVGTPVQPNERIRLSVQLPADFHLYVIDREMYADGGFSEPYVIFPTLRTNGGDNTVFRSVPVEIPAFDDAPPYFTLRRLTTAGGKTSIGEEISIFATVEPSPDIPLNRESVKLTDAQFRRLSAHRVGFEQFELIGGAGELYQAVEREAAQGAGRALTDDDPLPQTIFRGLAKPGAPIFMSVALTVAPLKE